MPRSPFRGRPGLPRREPGIGERGAGCVSVLLIFSWRPWNRLSREWGNAHHPSQRQNQFPSSAFHLGYGENPFLRSRVFPSINNPLLTSPPYKGGGSVNDVRI